MSRAPRAFSEDIDLKLIGLGKRFSKGSQRIDVLCDIDLTVRQGERLSIIGASGVGKSTLLGMMARYTKAEVNVIGMNEATAALVGAHAVHDKATPTLPTAH